MGEVPSNQMILGAFPLDHTLGIFQRLLKRLLRLMNASAVNLRAPVEVRVFAKTGVEKGADVYYLRPKGRALQSAQNWCQ